MNGGNVRGRRSWKTLRRNLTLAPSRARARPRFSIVAAKNEVGNRDAAPSESGLPAFYLPDDVRPLPLLDRVVLRRPRKSLA
jgi:hypothetical protein